MNIAFLTNKLEIEIEALESAYYRLVLLVGQYRTGKTRLLKTIQAKLELPLINLNLQLSKKLLYLTGRQRILGIQKMLDDLVAEKNARTVTIDNTEILFNINLKLDPLRVLKTMSRNTNIVATWNGYVDKENLCYAEPGHPEYNRYPAQGVRIVSMSE